MKTHNLIIVDDEAPFAELIKETQERRGFKCTIASTGEEALKLAESLKPDIILLDILLPGIDGKEILRRLKANPSTQGIPVIICSVTCKEKSQIQTLLEMGASGYVTKPCEPDDLANRLRSVL